MLTPQERKEAINLLKQQAAEKQWEAVSLAKQCSHKIIIQTEPDQFGFGYAECEGCDKDFGWYCPDSPDHVCHYYTENNKGVRLITGELVGCPANHDTRSETEDQCIFCGMPEERK